MGNAKNTIQIRFSANLLTFAKYELFTPLETGDLAGKEVTLGAEHLETLASVSNLALCLARPLAGAPVGSLSARGSVYLMLRPVDGPG